MTLRPNLAKLKKDQIVWLSKHTCKHSHTYLEHYSCFLSEKPMGSPLIEEHIGYLDIETTGLNGNWDYIICYAIEDEKGKKYGRILKPKEILNPDILDKKLMHEFCEEIKQFDRLVVYWGKDRRHDIPFLRTRALKWGEGFPVYGDLKVTDAYDIVRNKLSMHARRLQFVCDFFGVPSKLHRLDSQMWQRAKLADKKAIEHVWLHCVEDVESLKAVWNRLRRFASGVRVSI
jgi:uncharacterized protein YprB with RNaseH-like and TPR domain